MYVGSVAGVVVRPLNFTVRWRMGAMRCLKP